MSTKRQTTRWNIPVPQTLDDALEKAIFLDSHMTKSDFVRDAVRDKLASMGYKNEPFKEIPHDAREGKETETITVENKPGGE